MPKRKSPTKHVQLSLFNGEHKVELPKPPRLKKTNFITLRERFNKFSNKEDFQKNKHKIFEDLKRRYNKYDVNHHEQKEIKFGKNFIADVRIDLTKRLNLIQEYLINNIEKETKHNILLKNKENKALYRLMFVYKREGIDLLNKLDWIDKDMDYIHQTGPTELRFARSSQDVNEISQAISDKSSTIDRKKVKFIDGYCTFRAKYSILSDIKFLNEFAPRFNLKFEESKKF